MKIKAIIHEAEEGGYWAEVPALLGCATQGNSLEEVIHNLTEAIEACLSVDLEQIEVSEKDKILELSVGDVGLPKPATQPTRLPSSVISFR